MLGYMAQLFFKRHAFHPEANLTAPFKLLPFFVLGGLGTASHQTLLLTGFAINVTFRIFLLPLSALQNNETSF